MPGSGPGNEEEIWAAPALDPFIEGIEVQAVSDLRLALGVLVPAHDLGSEEQCKHRLPE